MFQAIGRLRNGDQMNMIRDQAIRPDLDLLGAAPWCHQFQVALVIFMTKERLLSAVSPLGDVMGQTRCDNRCQSGRERSGWRRIRCQEPISGALGKNEVSVIEVRCTDTGTVLWFLTPFCSIATPVSGSAWFGPLELPVER